MRKKLTLFSVVILVLVFSISAYAETTVVTIWNWSQEQTEFFNEMATEFEKENPDIDVEFNTIVLDQYRRTLPMALRSESGPDLFWIEPEQDPLRFVNNGWLASFDEYVDDEFLSQFDESLLVEGKMYYNDELYSLPYYNPKVMLNGLMFYNIDVFEKAGLDPETDIPETYSEFRETLKHITEAGNGEYYGIVWGGKPGQELHRVTNGFFPTGTVASADARYGYEGFDYRDGKFKADNENHMNVYNLLQGIVDDGSITPGWSSMDKGTARAIFAQNKAAFYFDGEWMKNVWAGMGFPDLNFDIAPVPVPDDGRKGYRVMNIPHGQVHVSAFTEDMEKTMKVYKWLHGVDFQTELLKRKLAFPANMKVDYDKHITDDYRKSILKIAEDYVVTAPEPIYNNVNAGSVTWPSVNPGLNDIIASALSGDVNYKEAAAEWNQKMTEELGRNIQKARDEGNDVSIEDFMFPDWSPLEDYVK